MAFVDANRKVYRRLLHFAFSKVSRKCSRWHDYEMIVEPYRDGEPVRYRFISCPVAEFARHMIYFISFLPSVTLTITPLP